MKLLPDPKQRFEKRPHYEPWELDAECEGIVEEFLRSLYGEVQFPILTDDLTRLIERYTDDFDSSADLSHLGENVEGVTDFYFNAKPRVRIAGHLWNRENRLRTTLAHEFGHVKFHNYLYQVEPSLELFESAIGGVPLRCKREDIHGHQVDWMEWQAGYVSGAILMPESAVRATAKEVKSGDIGALLGAVIGRFQVSEDAARVRVSKLGLLADQPGS
jgi:IrrE N-terminal-like domain